MLGLKNGINSLNNAGTSTNDLFADVSTRKLESISVGESSGKISKGTGNAFVGFESGKYNIDGSFGVFVGYQAGTFNKQGNWNTYVGAYSGQKNNRGVNNTFIGFKAGQLNADGSESTAIGVNAMRESSVGNRNVAVGFNAGERLLEGDNNTMIGSEAGQNIRSGNLNTMAGYRSGRGSFRGNQNTYFGAYSGYSNSEGDGNSLIGYGAGEFLVNGNLNVAVGAYSLQNLSNGDSNTSVGSFAGRDVIGTGNVLLGTSVAASNELGDDNTIIGKNAAYNTVGDKNVVIGASDDIKTIGSNNYSNSVIIGYKSENSVFKSGSGNIFIGIGADSVSSSASNAIAIGSKSTFVSNDSISIGEKIQNIGANSVLLGYNIYSDSKNCVSLGHEIRIDNVNIFYDPLDGITPVLTNNYVIDPVHTQTLTIGRLLNSNAAAATVYSRKDYDSVNNLLSGISVNKTANSLNLNIEFRPITIEQTSDTNITTLITDYVVQNNLVIADTPIVITSINSNLNIVNSDILTNNYAVNVSPSDSNTTDSYNLIPTSNFNNIFNIHVARRLNIEYYNSNGEITTETAFMSAPSISISTDNYIIKKPTYGYFNDSNEYTQHIESLYAEGDSYSLVRVNTFEFDDSNAYNIIPEEKLIYDTEISFNDTYNKIYTTSNIYLHQTYNTLFDKSYLNKITESTDAFVIKINSIDSNLILTYANIEYDSTMISTLQNIQIPYSDFSFLIKIKDNNASTDSNLEIKLSLIHDTDSTEYTFNCIHSPIMDFIEMFETNIYIEQFSIEEVKISRRNGIIIRSHPKYGTAQITPEDGGLPLFSYTPRIFNFGEDSFSVSVTDFDKFYGIYYNRIVTVNIYTKSTTTKFRVTKVQEPEIIDTDTPNNFNIDGTINIYEDMYGNFIYSVPSSTGGEIYKTTITHNIPTVQLQDTTVYNYDGIYERLIGSDDINNDRNILILKKGVGEVDSFTQKDISEKKIHIYNAFPFFSRSGIGRIFFKDSIEIEINYIYTPTQIIKKSADIDITSEWTNINHTDNVVFIDGKPLLIDPTLNDKESYFEYAEIGTRLTLYKITITKKEILINNLLYLNAGFEPTKRYLTPSDLLFVKDFNEPQDIKFKFSNIDSNIKFYKQETDSNVLTVSSFTQQDINSNVIYIETDAINPVTDEISIKGTIKIGTDTIRSDFDFKINIYLHNQFKQNLDSPSSNVLVQFNETYDNQLVGGLWEYINNDDVSLHITKPPTNGFLYVEELTNSYSITNKISFGTLRNKTTRLRYIPYVPMDMQNDTYECVFEYKGRSSPRYTILIKNYWSKWEPLEVPNIEELVVQHINDIYRSEGMRDDDIFWEKDTNSSVKLKLPHDIRESYTNKLENVIQRKVFTSLEINLDTEIYGNIYFNDLFSTLDKYEVGKNVIFFIITAPTNGAILRESSTSHFEAGAHFDTEDIINNKVFYQHFGKSKEGDTIKIKVGTNNYDLSDNECTINISINEPIIVSTNLYDYIYHDTIASGKSNFNLIDTNHLDLSKADGIINVYGSSNNIDLFIKEEDEYKQTTSFTKEDIARNVVFYRPSESFFDSGSNLLSFEFTTTTNSLIANKLATFYETFFVNKWYAKYNTFESISTLLTPPINIINEQIQIISYTSTEGEPLNLGGKKITFEFEYLPMRDIFLSPILDDTINISEYTYTFELVKLGEEVFFSMEFTKDAIIVKYNESTYTIDKEQADPSVFEFNTFKTLSLVANDNLNNGKLSIYINSINYTLFSDSEPLPTISNDDLDSLRIIRISVPINENSLSKKTGTTTIGDTTFYYDLEHYSKSLFFRNFKILSPVDNEVVSIYNIVIGDKLDIKGFKNICIGQNFATSGQGSIIIGNDIGREELAIQDTSQQSINEIFNSIVISTDSFKNTKVRDIIAIGNNILNNANVEDIIKIEEFLLKKPVLIGNNIDTSKLDYHINFENTFLKTTVGYPQIYCGLNNETVCIGYTSNMMFNNDLNKLYVNNNAIITGNIGIGTTKPIKPLHVVGDILATGDIVAFSDRRLKSEIQPITNALNKIASIEGVTYLRDDILSKKRYAGLIAQDVEGVLPEVVHTMDDEHSTKSIAYGNFTALLVQGINELNKLYNNIGKPLNTDEESKSTLSPLSSAIRTRKTSIIATSPSLNILQVNFSPCELNNLYQVIVTGSIPNKGTPLSFCVSKTVSSIKIQAMDTLQKEDANEIMDFTLDIIMMRDGILIDSFSWDRDNFEIRKT